LLAVRLCSALILARAGAVSVFVVLHSWLCAAGVAEQDLEPRAYSNAPIGLNFLILGGTHQTGSVLVDPALPVKTVVGRFRHGGVRSLPEIIFAACLGSSMNCWLRS